jgi:23S rRNA pseudouridine2605 synthase
MNDSEMRIARYLAAAGLGSRRACEDLVRSGAVTVNGERLDSPARNVVPGEDRICVRGRPVMPEKLVHLALNKPPGYTCSSRDSHADHLVHELVPTRLGRLFTVGRLDRDSEGLILLTNDGDFSQAVSHPSCEIEKIYQVDCRGEFTSTARERLLAGVQDEGEFLRPRDVILLEQKGGHCRLEFRLGEGRKREVRRLCRAVGLRVERLIRQSIGPLHLGNLASGAWRELSPAEVAALRAASRRSF